MITASSTSLTNDAKLVIGPAWQCVHAHVVLVWRLLDEELARYVKLVGP